MFSFAFVAAFVATHPAPRDVVKETIDEMTLPGMSIAAVDYEDCGFLNAAYTSNGGMVPWGKQLHTVPAHSLVICNELLKESDSVVRFIVAHEMSHAIIDQRAIPYTGSQEAAADELAAVWLSSEGRAADVLETAVWFQKMKSEETPYDEHPSNARRAWILACYADGSEGDNAANERCAYLYDHAFNAWVRLLSHEVK